jgi:hypothetical protein
VASDNPGVARLATPVVTIPADESSASFNVFTGATVVPVTVVLRATLRPANAITVQTSLGLVPALIDKVTLNSPTMIGTRGTSIEGTVQLKAPAPSGGIQLYLSPPMATPSTGLKRSGNQSSGATQGGGSVNGPRINAGSKTASFQLRYDAVLAEFSDPQLNSRDFSRTFEEQSRLIEHVVALDPQSGSNWAAIRDRAVKVGFTLNPLRIASFTAQQANLVAGSEGVGTFTLNAPPSTGEFAILTTRGSAGRVALLGASCQASSPVAFPLNLPLTSGLLTYSFKICAGAVTTPTTLTVDVTLRSGTSSTPITVRP